MTVKKIFALVKNNFSAITLNQILRKLFCKNHPGPLSDLFFYEIAEKYVDIYVFSCRNHSH